MGESSGNLTLRDALFNPIYRKATWVNLCYIVFHELTGINVIMLYSTTIFKQMKGGSFTPRLGTQIVGIVDLLACFLSIWTVKKFGRVTLVIWGHLLIAGAHLGVGISVINGNNTGVLLFVLLFLVIYQNTSGPIAWLYAAETTIDAALGICIFTLWGTVFILSIISPILMKDENLGE